jgi:hypothetical protein
MGTHHFDGSGKELLRRDRSVGAALAKRGVNKASSGFVAFGASSTAPTPRLPSFSSKRRREASPERERVEIDLNSSDEDLPGVDEVIATKVPRFGTARIRSGSSAGFGSAATKKSHTVSFDPVTPTKPSKLTSAPQRDIPALVPSFPQGSAPTSPNRVPSIRLNGVSNLLEWNSERLWEALATVGLIGTLWPFLMLTSLL